MATGAAVGAASTPRVFGARDYDGPPGHDRFGPKSKSPRKGGHHKYGAQSGRSGAHAQGRDVGWHGPRGFESYGPKPTRVMKKDSLNT